jgi:hypothetical protein
MNVLSPALMIASLFAVLPPAGASQNPEKPVAKPRNKFTISKETTYVLGPVDADGYIDYAAVLNERLGKGVTPENNACVLVWQAIGPKPEGKLVPPEFFRLMGIASPPEQGEYFVPWSKYLEETLKIDFYMPEREKLDKFEFNTSKSPWRERDCPELAAWLKANEKPLGLLVQASKRSQYFSPLVVGKPETGASNNFLGAALDSANMKLRDMTHALCERAMLRTADGSINAGWEDLLACHRLARLIGRRGTAFDGLVGCALEQVAVKAELEFLDGAKPNAAQIDRCLNDLRGVPSAASIPDSIDLAERFLSLDTLTRINRESLKSWLDATESTPAFLRLVDESNKAQVPNRAKMKRLRNMSLEVIELDQALKDVNNRFDRHVAALRQKDLFNRQSAFEVLEREQKKLDILLFGPGRADPRITGDGKARGMVIGDLIAVQFMPNRATLKVMEAANRAQQSYANVVLAFALARYKLDHQRYPAELSALAPKYLPQIPLDIFSGKPLVYRLTENGYLLYSVGPNGKDEDGRGYTDEPRGDDISVRMPLPAPRK